MAVFFNKETGYAENASQFNPEQHEVYLLSPDGQLGSAPEADASKLMQQGYKVPSIEHLAPALKEAKYGPQDIKAFGEGALRGVLSAPLATAIEKRYLGVKPEDIRGRQDENPIASGAGELTTLVGGALTGVGEGALLEKLGSAAGGKGITGAAVKGAVENAAYQTGEEAHRMIADDPEASSEAALAHIGLSGVIGGAAGLGFGATGALLRGSSEKLGALAGDVKQQLRAAIENTDPVAATTEALQKHYESLRATIKSVNGESGLKAQNIEKLVPEFNDKMVNQANKLSASIQEKIATMESKPNKFPASLVQELRDKVDEVGAAVTSNDSKLLFNSMQEVKRDLQALSKFDMNLTRRSPDFHFVQEVKGLGAGVKEALEDRAVWGEAGAFQKKINAATGKQISALGDFESKFTTEINGQRVIDPGKISTFLRQEGKDSGIVKRSMMENYLNASDQFHNEVAKVHENLGLEVPARADDAILRRPEGNRHVAKLIEKGISTPISLGGMPININLGLKHLLPLLKPLLSKEVNGAGLHAANEYANAVQRGVKKMSQGVDSVFGMGKAVVANPSKSDTDKLETRMDKLAQNPDGLMKLGGSIGHYLPDHNTALVSSTINKLNYLQSLKPKTEPQAPLDPVRKPDPVELARYNSALQIAQEPLLVLAKIKNGSITTQNIQDLAIMSPALYRQLQGKITEGLVNAKHKGQIMPYNTKLGLSLFLGQPLDSSMNPQAIMNNQMTMQKMHNPAPQPHGSLKSTSKLPQALSSTPDSVAARRQNRSR